MNSDFFLKTYNHFARATNGLSAKIFLTEPRCFHYGVYKILATPPKQVIPGLLPGVTAVRLMSTCLKSRSCAANAHPSCAGRCFAFNGELSIGARTTGNWSNDALLALGIKRF
jgi:hypothetical protein